ncbi:MAG: nuclear transport factor 2 family protein [Solirubrobacteraceae bacterium]|nr:nuclear transport factor 2 family protein [Solirubrobacteraceae bacterium]
MSQSNAELVRSGYEAFAAGDIPAVLAIFADDISWTIPGRSPISRTYTGHDEVLGFFGQLMERSNGTFSLEIHDVLDNGADQVALLVTETARRDDASLTDPGMHLWTVQDGKATNFRAFAGDQYANDEFWS